MPALTIKRFKLALLESALFTTIVYVFVVIPSSAVTSTAISLVEPVAPSITSFSTPLLAVSALIITEAAVSSKVAVISTDSTV